jgi:hypothetical protein
MHTKEELETVWKLFNLLHKLSDLLFDRYDHYLLGRFMEEEETRYWTEHYDDLKRLTTKP